MVSMMLFADPDTHQRCAGFTAWRVSRSGDSDAVDLPVDINRCADERVTSFDWLEKVSLRPAHEKLQSTVGGFRPDYQWEGGGIDDFGTALVDEKSDPKKKFTLHERDDARLPLAIRLAVRERSVKSVRTTFQRLRLDKGPCLAGRCRRRSAHG
jgi:hypothetical protein